MLIDADTLAPGTRIDADVVIVGAGAAGLVLARELSDAGLSVCVLESGGIDHDEPAATDLSRGTGVIAGPDGEEIACDDYLHTSRARGLGGTLNLWGGKCGELDPIDFEQRDWIRDSGWPLSKADLQPYYDRACYRFGIPTVQGVRRQLEAGNAVVKLNGERNFNSALRMFSGSTGNAPGEGFDRFKAEFGDDPSIRIHLHATVTGIVSDADGGRIEQLTITRTDGATLSAYAPFYVLAAGGLENARLLLDSTATAAAGLGNANDLVGRYFSGHGVLREINGPGRPPATIPIDPSIAASLPLYLHKDPAHPQALFSATRGLQAREQLPGFAATLEPIDDPQRPGATPVFFSIEQIPNPDSRVTLSDARDALGSRRVHLAWRFTAQDFDALGRAIGVFARDVEKSGWGTLDYDPDDLRLTSALELARHHIGTTRMHADPGAGVVDADCRIHGIDNMFVAGASVFPTSGIVNPTLTIAALAIRLADHLRASFETRTQ